MPIAVTYTFSPLTLILSAEVNQNFLDVRDAIRAAHHQDADGTKIVNADVSASAAIVYSKLNLATSIVDADINASAAIAWSKLSKSGSSIDDLGDVTLSSPVTGQALRYNGSAWVNQNLSGVTTLIETYTGTDASKSFTGLAGNSDGYYILRGYCKSSTASSVRLTFNADTSNNYITQAAEINNSSTNFQRTASQAYIDLTFEGLGSGDAVWFEATIYPVSGDQRLVLVRAVNIATQNIFFGGGKWSNTANEITSLEVKMGSGSFASGTRISLYKVSY